MDRQRSRSRARTCDAAPHADRGEADMSAMEHDVWVTAMEELMPSSTLSPRQVEEVRDLLDFTSEMILGLGSHSAADSSANAETHGEAEALSHLEATPHESVELDSVAVQSKGVANINRSYTELIDQPVAHGTLKQAVVLNQRGRTEQSYRHGNNFAFASKDTNLQGPDTGNQQDTAWRRLDGRITDEHDAIFKIWIHSSGRCVTLPQGETPMEETTTADASSGSRV